MRPPFPIDVPSLARRQDTTKRAALPQTAPEFVVPQQQPANLSPVLLEDFSPFVDRRLGRRSRPPVAHRSSLGQTRPPRIPIDAIDDGPRQEQAAPINLAVRFHVRQYAATLREKQAWPSARLSPPPQKKGEYSRAKGYSEKDYPTEGIS